MPIDKLTKPECCGCNVCGDVCPVQAISFKTDYEGFWYPEVDYDKCTHCELCTKICPVINIDTLKHNDFPDPECYAAENKNLEVVFDSTSGGLFSAFADRMYRDGGNVGGAVFSEDYRTVKQFISPDKKDLPRLRSSKYLQSDLQGFYTQVKDLLNKGEKVLVCGCPCQMAALRSFLRKPYENLLILDFICLGINSPLIWQKYLDTFEERYGSKVVYAKPKSKELGWRNLTQKFKLSDGSVKFETRTQSIYTKGYIGTHSYIRPSCYQCVFRGFPRIADVTLADFWGIEKHSKALEKDLGTSLVMINSIKGKEFFKRIKDRLNYIKLPLETTLAGNQALLKDPFKPNINREEFFNDVHSMSFSKVAEKYGFDSNQKHIIGKRERIRILFNLLRLILTSFKHLPSTLRTLRYNRIIDIKNNTYISFGAKSYAQIDKTVKLELKGKLRLGHGRFKKAHMPTQLLLDSNSKLSVLGNFLVGRGSNIEVFPNAELILKGGGGTNVNFTCICAKKIEIGKGVMIGRGVTIRDNNGNHYINRNGYKESRPVIIGDKAWLCEGCTIMPGVKIGHGAIIGAKAVVTSNVPANTMVVGNPAKIVDEDVLWKY